MTAAVLAHDFLACEMGARIGNRHRAAQIVHRRGKVMFNDVSILVDDNLEF